MPQMSPLMWTFIFLLLCFMIVNLLSNFEIMNKVNKFKNKMNKKFNKMKW